MTSEKQLVANRLNGLKGGVKTEKGKAAVRLNAVSHGLLSKEVLLPGEDRHLLAELRDRLMNEFKPIGEMETILVERIVSSTWRLRRTFKLEKGVKGVGDYSYIDWQNQIRYETAIERQIYKALNELERLQKSRNENLPALLSYLEVFKQLPEESISTFYESALREAQR